MRAEQKSRETAILSLRVREKVTLTQTRTVTEKEPQYGRKVQTRNRRDRKTHKDRNYSGRLTDLTTGWYTVAILYSYCLEIATETVRYRGQTVQFIETHTCSHRSVNRDTQRVKKKRHKTVK